MRLHHCAVLSRVFLAAPAAGSSTCFGTVSKGRLEGGVSLPARGTYVHASVGAIVVDAYARVAKARPDLRFVYGETGWKNGGRFKPDRVDFAVKCHAT